MNVVIVGGPSVGKTTLAGALGPQVRHTDELLGRLEWSEASEEVSRWFDEPGEWVIEGTVTVRAIRKWLRRESGPFPAGIMFLREARVGRTPGQEAMAKGVLTIWNEIVLELIRRKTSIHYG